MWRDRNLRKAFETAAAAAGLEDFRFHDLRHSLASSFMMRGGGLVALREILGHATMAIRYSHLSPAHLRGETERTAAPAAVPLSARSRVQTPTLRST